jgi:5-hydroxyisourate hydrolase
VSTVSTHVLDSATGLPAAGMPVELETAIILDQAEGRVWLAQGNGVTDADGRLNSWGGAEFSRGSYRLIFDTGAWFADLDRECFYPEVIITFTVNDDGSHYHVPLLLAAYAYSTYRGS